MMSMRCRALGEERRLILPESSTSVGWRRLLDPIVTFVLLVISSMIPLNQNRFCKPTGNKVLKETYSANKYWPPSTWVYVNKLSITWSKRFTAVSILRRETSAATRSYRLSACMYSTCQLRPRRVVILDLFSTVGISSTETMSHTYYSSEKRQPTSADGSFHLCGL